MEYWNSLYSEYGGILFVVLFGLSGFILGLIIFKIGGRIIRAVDWVEGKLLRKIKKPALILLVLSSVMIAAQMYLEEVYFPWKQIFQISFIVAFSWLLAGFVSIGRYLIGQQYDTSSPDNLKARKVYTQLRVFERIINVIIVIIAIALSLMTFEEIRNLGASILASAGVAGIIVGFAAQKVLANLLAGFQIAITQPIRLEDVVIIENEWGWIEEITLTYVVVRIWDKRRLVVPSTAFIEKPFQNWTRRSADILGTVFLYVDYTTPVQRIREKLTEILKETSLWDGKVNVLQVTNATDKAMELRALVSAKDSPTAWDLRVLVREKLIEFLQTEFPDCLPKARVELDEKRTKEDNSSQL